uniref:Uncharacterized protein n=1 Tax=Anguilla anguilla TaxID=7936 RepID=A0A0E9WQQ4_ANGAN
MILAISKPPYFYASKIETKYPYFHFAHTRTTDLSGTLPYVTDVLDTDKQGSILITFTLMTEP